MTAQLIEYGTENEIQLDQSLTIYCVLLDAEETCEHKAYPMDHWPTDRDETNDSQVIGFHLGGYWAATSPEEAISAAIQMFDEEGYWGGCVA